MEQLEFQGMQYVISYPNSYIDKKKYPLLIYMHGAGTRGTDLEKVKGAIIFEQAQKGEFPFLLAAPLCHKNNWFDLFETLKRWICELVKRGDVDPARVYLTGASMGGYATWQLAMSMPEMFAAIVPVCGGGMYWNAARLKNVPVWAFHGAKDGTVLPRESEILVDKINKHGGDARLTIYPENGHNAWADTYTNPAVYEWLLSHCRKEAKLAEDQYTDSKIFG